MQVRTGTEEEICQQCRRTIMEADEDVFILTAERMTKVLGEWKLVSGRLFPGYVFAETDEAEDFFLRLKQKKINAKVLRTGDEITPLYPEEETYLKKLGGKEHLVKYSEGYLEGERLVVTSGAMMNYKGTVKKVLRHKRLIVLEVPLMGRAVEVAVGVGIVERQL